MQKIGLLICTIILGVSSFAIEIPYAQTDLIYQSNEAIDDQLKKFEPFAEEKILIFTTKSKEEAFTAWSSLYAEFLYLKRMLLETAALSTTLKSYAEEQSKYLHKLLKEKIDSKEVINTFVKMGLAAASLTPEQRYLTENVLKESGRAEEALKTLSAYEKTNYALKQTKTPFADPSKMQNLKVLSANIICFPGLLTYFYGGIIPWKARIDKVVNALVEPDADILCLQEVWDPKAMQALLEKLEKKYSFFIYDAGNQFGTLTPENIGLCSGLFIASKIPLNQISFYPFPRSIPAKAAPHRGFIMASCSPFQRKLTFANTHLQHSNNEPFESVRQEQLFLCYAHLQNALGDKNTWGFLTGDININAFTPEFYKNGLSNLFSIPYVKNLSKITPENATETLYFNDLIFIPDDKRASFTPIFEILDYTVSPTCASLQMECTQKIIPLFNIKEPQNALSDHHGLLTIWNLPKEKQLR